MRSVCSGEKYVLNNQNVPTGAVWPEQQQLLALLWEVGGVPGEEVAAGTDANGEMATKSHDLPHVLAAAEVGACRTWAS